MSHTMRSPFMALTLLGALTLGVCAADTQRYLIVKIEGHDEEITYEILTRDQHKELLADLRLESRFHGEALKEAKALWRESKNGKRTFPTQAIQRRSARVEGASNMSMDRAHTKRDSLKRRLEAKSTLGERRYSKSSVAHKRKNADRRTKNAFNTSAYQKDKDKLNETARKLYIQQLTALMDAEKGVGDDTEDDGESTP